MKFTETELPGAFIIEPDVHGDARGFFLETYREDRYREAGIVLRFVQDNHSRSSHGTLRGLHAQSPRAQGKLIRVIEGEIFDVAVDVRLGSPAFGRHVAVTLSAENFRQLYVPPGMLHGFCVTSDVAEVEYKCTAAYHPEDELTVLWSEPELAIPWPHSDPVLSDKDRGGLRLRDVWDRLLAYEPRG